MKFKTWMVTAALSVSATTFAQGIPTYDAANVLAAMQQLLAWEKQYQQMYQQYVNQTSVAHATWASPTTPSQRRS